jgi:hypothetical protein
MLFRRSGLPAVLFLTLLFSATHASAVQYGFGCITNNIAGDCTIAEAQITMDVTDAGSGKVSFLFSNVGADDSSITDVYFDDGSLLSLDAIMNTPTMVEFTALASPSNLPGANNASPPFVTSTGFSADSNPPAQPLGVNPSETLAIIFDTIGGQDFNDVITELADKTLRVGIHVQGFGTGGSESLVNVPEPSTALLLLMGMGLLASRRSGSPA